MAGEIKHYWNGTVLTIVSDSGTSACDLKGEKGDDGCRGPMGVCNGTHDGASTAYIDEKLSGYYTKEETDTAIETAMKDISGVELDNYYTKTETDNAIKAAKPDLTPYAKKTEIPNTDGLATKVYVDNAIAAIPQQDMSGYVKTVNGKQPNNYGEVYITATINQPGFVESVDDMEDTSKAYVLTTTGNVWAYGKVSNQPAFTDLTTPDDWEWAENSRTNSSGTFSTDTGSWGGSYISCGVGDVIYIQGLKLKTSYSDTLSVQYFKSDKSYIQAGSTAYLRTAGIITEEGDITIIQAGKTSDDGATEKEVANCAYMRFSGMPLDGYTIDDVIITVNEEIVYTTGEAWKDTGIVYNQPADYEERVIALENKVENNTGDIALLQKQVNNIGNGIVETVIPTYWEESVNECIEKIKALQVGRNCITFPFFSDNHQRNGYAGVLIKKIMDECHMPYCFYGGDSISSGYIETEAEMIAQDKAFDTMLSVIPNGKVCRAVGNHDGYWLTKAGVANTYTRAQVYELFIREESTAQNKQYGEDGTYYFVDDIASKVRFIVMNTNGGNVDNTQLIWLQNTALTFNNSGWAVVFISHQPISNHYHANISNAAEVRAIIQNYINGSASNKADIVGWFSGHIHKDRIYTGVATNTTDDAEGAEMGFTQITITSDNTSIAYDDTTKHTVSNDNQSHAIDFITINKATKKVNITRLGIGEDREYSY